MYLDLGFFDDLQSRFGVGSSAFVQAYVIAHEYGHHVQDLVGTEAKVKQGDTGPTSSSVRLELQADCFAGVWAKNASTVSANGTAPLISNITATDIANTLYDYANSAGIDLALARPVEVVAHVF